MPGVWDYSNTSILSRPNVMFGRWAAAFMPCFVPVPGACAIPRRPSLAMRRTLGLVVDGYVFYRKNRGDTVWGWWCFLFKDVNKCWIWTFHRDIVYVANTELESKTSMTRPLKNLFAELKKISRQTTKIQRCATGGWKLLQLLLSLSTAFRRIPYRT